MIIDSTCLKSLGYNFSPDFVKPFNEDRASGVKRCMIVALAVFVGLYAVLNSFAAFALCCPIAMTTALFSLLFGYICLVWSATMLVCLFNPSAIQKTIK